MKTFPIMYKRNSNGTINQWTIVADGNGFYTIEGQVDGVQTTSKPTVCKGKNIGKKSETTDEQQAISEATSKVEKKIKRGYTEDISKVDTCKTTFTPMLAHKYVDRKNEIVFPVLVSRKIDGLRLISRQDGGWTRNGEPFLSVPHIATTLSPIFEEYPEWIIDSEVYNHDIPFEKVVSIVKKKKPTPADLIESEKYAKIYIFDGVINDPDADFQTRFDEIKKEIKRLIGKDRHLVFVENDIAYSHEDIQKFHDQYVSEGWEGIMIRKIGSTYENKRSKNLLKFKYFEDDEFVIEDILEGQGNRAGMAGKMVITLKKPTTEGKTTCEAGIKGGEEFYTELWKNKARIIGKKATVRYQGFTDKGSLRFPVVRVVDPMDR